MQVADAASRTVDPGHDKHIARSKEVQHGHRPTEDRKKENLSLKKLPDLVVDVDLKNNLNKLLEVATAKTEFCRDWRNRRFAHHDLALAINSNAEPLENADKEKFAEALKALAAVINAVENHYFDSYTSFDDILSPRGAAALLRVLGDGQKAQERREKAILEGRFGELDNPDAI